MTTPTNSPNPTASAPPPGRYMLNRREVAAVLGVSMRTVARWTADRHHAFPQPYRFGVTRWLRSEVIAWLEKHRG